MNTNGIERNMHEWKSTKAETGDFACALAGAADA